MEERKETASTKIEVKQDLNSNINETNNSDLNDLKGEVKKFYNSLLSFTDNNDFQTFGFRSQILCFKYPRMNFT